VARSLPNYGFMFSAIINILGEAMNNKRLKFFLQLTYVLLLPVFSYAQAPVANFNANLTSGCAPLVVNFTDVSTNNPTSWSWDLGNGTLTTVQNPTTTYLNPGVYTIKLTATNASGSNTITKTNFITVNALPNVNFSAPDTSGCAPFTANFTDLSTAGTGTITAWEWNFGDGGTSTLQNPTHIYTNPGTYGVFLKVTNSAGCSKIFFKSQYIIIGGTLTPDFTVSIPSYCTTPVNVSFTNNTTGTGTLSYSWNFGDGGTSTAVNPTHTYSSYNNFVVTLTATNNGGCVATLLKPVSIQLKTTQFTAPDSLCVGAVGSFIVTSTPKPLSTTFTMGDGNTFTTDTVLHSYATQGTYIIKLKNNFGGCIDSITKPIKINPVPVANFSAPITTSCKAPFTVNFTNTSTGAATYLWNFGDGTTSTLASPTHTYTTLGSFTVTLTAITNKGCSTQVVKNNFIQIVPPTITINNLPIAGCAPLSFTPNYIVSAGSVIASYNWDFGDGFTSNLPNPSHTYTVPGIYTFKVFFTTTTGCSDSAVYSNKVKIGVIIPLDFTATPTAVCAKKPIQFTSTAGGIVNSYQWSFGDLTNDNTPNPIHIYQDTGFFNVTLATNYNGCITTVTKPNYIYVQPPIADFFITRNCNQRNTIQFTNTSIQANSVQWDFGDGTPLSATTNPTHIYATSGTYNVRLVAFNTTCSDTTALAIKVYFGNLSLTTNKDTSCRKARVIFFVNSPNAAILSTYKWDFGDGNIITTVNAPIGWDYQISGNLLTSVIVTDENNCKDTLYKPTPIVVTGPRANFKGNPLGGCTGLNVNFTDSSYNENISTIQQWQWTFGDGSSITNTTNALQNHTYITAGNYDVSLKVTDQLGCVDSFARPAYVNVSKLTPKLFSPDSMSCGGKTIRFADSTIGSPISWLWHFGDGTTSSLQNPTHVYPDTGRYTVKLVVTAAYGCKDSVVKTNYITIKNPKAKFSVSDSTTTCPPLQVNFYDSSYYTNNWSWTFGDGGNAAYQNAVYVYFIPGQYTAKLVVTSLGGCKDSATKTIKIGGPYGSLTYAPINGCKGLNVNFKTVTTGAISFIWDYADGFTTVINDSSITHQYNTAGKYTPRVLLKDATGCIVPVNGVDTVFIQGTVPNFTASNFVLCDAGTTTFTNTSTTNALPLNYKWSFGDGTNATVQNPTHNYTNTGLYNVQLITTTPLGCKDTITKNNFIKVVASPIITAINVNNTALCIPAAFTFTPQLVVDTSAITNWQWSFGNGNTAIIQNPPAQNFITAGTYTNQLIVTNSSGCKDTATRITYVATRAPVNIINNDTTVCRGSNIQLNTTGANSYTWLAPTTYLSATNIANPLAKPLTSIKYVVRGTMNNGCVGEDSINIVIQSSQPAFTASNTVLCDAGTTIFTENTTTNGSPLTYNWSFGDGTNAVVQNPTHNYAATGLYNVKLVTTTALGCKDSITNNNFIKVVKSPVPTIAMVDSALCMPASFTFSPQLVADTSTIINWSWAFGNGNASALQNPPVQLFATAGVYPNSLTVTNSSGCSKTVIRNSYVYALPTVNIINNDTTICKGSSITLTATGGNTYTWLTPNNNLSCINCSMPVANPAANIQYKVQGTNANGCSAYDSINIQVMQPYTLALLTTNKTICKGQQVQLVATGAPNYAWTPTTWLSDATIANPIAIPDSSIIYKVVGYDSLNCFNDSATVTINVVKHPTVSLGPDITIGAGNIVTLTPTVSSDVVGYSWTPSIGLNCTTCPNPQFTAFDNRTYRVRVNNTGGCSSSDEINIIVTCDGNAVFIPNTFSPNNDGMNDVFFIRSKGVFVVESMRIFNRWGAMIFEKRQLIPNNPSYGWDGTVNGEKPQAGVYTYQVEVRCTNSQLLKYSGTITLIQ
jgi:gliding motility-associated-like protein